MICESCGKEHEGVFGSGRFCNKSCASHYSTMASRVDINKKVSIALGGTGELKTKFTHCVNCGKQKNNNYARKFCTIECSVIYKNKIHDEEIIKNNGFINYTTYSTCAGPKRFLIRQHGHQCMICKNTEWMGKPIPLVMDHIDGKSDNWNLDNLRIVCGNCDMQLSTYKSKNKGNSTRKFRMQLSKN